MLKIDLKLFPVFQLAHHKEFCQLEIFELSAGLDIWRKTTLHYVLRLILYKMYNASPIAIVNVNAPQHLYVTHKHDFFLLTKISYLENPGIDASQLGNLRE